MKWSRKVRKKLTVRILQFGHELAQKGDRDKIEKMRDFLRTFLRYAFPLRSRLKTNIKKAGMNPDGLVDKYFERSIDQLMMLAHIAGEGLKDSGVLELFEFDDSIGILENAYSKGKGVITIAPHISGYPVLGGILSQKIPCVIYLRHNKDPKKMRITKEIAESGGGELVYPPKGTSKSQRLKVALDVLRDGKMMFITPDTPRKPYQGVEVNILGKKAHFPTGVFVMSLRTGAPVVPIWWHWDNGIYKISFTEQIELDRGGDLRQKTEQATQKWASDVDKFLREHPDMWWNWLDKRWTQIIRNGSLTKS